MEIMPSKEMRLAGAIPSLYREDVASEAIAGRNPETPSTLGASPSNLALYFDMTKFSEGEHYLSFKLFFENNANAERLQSFKSLGRWLSQVARVSLRKS